MTEDEAIRLLECDPVYREVLRRNLVMGRRDRAMTARARRDCFTWYHRPWFHMHHRPGKRRIWVMGPQRRDA